MRLTVFVVLALAAGATSAHAYPQFQFSTGAETCKDCHYSPGGGGLINDYGRDEAFQREYVAAAVDPEKWRAFHERWLTVDHAEYQKLLGAR